MTIKFGTSGWRGVIARDFSFTGVRLCSQAIADEIFRRKDHNKPVVVGYDTRFLSESFAREAANVLAENGMEIRLSDRDVPTPVLSYEVIRIHAAGAINITASHNPWNYNGLKYSTDWGGPAPADTTRDIEETCLLLSQNGLPNGSGNKDQRLIEKLIRLSDFKTPYLRHVRSLIDAKALKKAKLKIVVDVMHGTARGYLPDLLREMGCDVEVLHDRRDVLFEGRGPDPSTEGLKDLVERVKAAKADLGLATDGDADRFGVVDSGGRIFSANEILALLARYLVEARSMRGILAKSVMTTNAIDAIARHYGLSLKETPVGFKYIAEIMKDADSITPSKDGEFVMGGEESGGFTMRGHIPEKDGILASLLVAEMVAVSGKTVSALLDDFAREVGLFYSRRINVKSTPEIVAAVKDRFSSRPPMSIDGLNVHRIVDIDGYKFIFQDGSWLGIRFSGTEPIVRLYYEADDRAKLDRLEKAGHSLIVAPAKRRKSGKL